MFMGYFKTNFQNWYYLFNEINFRYKIKNIFVSNHKTKHDVIFVFFFFNRSESWGFFSILFLVLNCTFKYDLPLNKTKKPFIARSLSKHFTQTIISHYFVQHSNILRCSKCICSAEEQQKNNLYIGTCNVKSPAGRWLSFFYTCMYIFLSR